MTATQLDELQRIKSRIKALTVEQYHRMAETGILQSGEPIELLDGFLVHKDRSSKGAPPMTVGPSHSWAIEQIAQLCAAVPGRGFRLRVQQPITLPPGSEPEPDVTIVRGTEYRTRHPVASEVICIFEVADSSLQGDRTTKLRIYAENSIPIFIIVNLVNGTVELYTHPISAEGRYGNVEAFARGNAFRIDLPDGSNVELPVDRILP